QVARRHEAGDVREVLEQHALAIGQALEPRAVVLAEAAPQGEVGGAVHHVHGVDLHAAGTRGELGQRALGHAPAARAVQPLPLEEQRRDRAARDGRAAGAPRASAHDVRPGAGYASPRSSTKWTNRGSSARARAPRLMCSRQPGFEATTTSGDTLATAASL